MIPFKFTAACSTIFFPFKDQYCPSNLISKIFCWSSINLINSLIF